jgi:hypothetical protein
MIMPLTHTSKESRIIRNLSGKANLNHTGNQKTIQVKLDCKTLPDTRMSFYLLYRWQSLFSSMFMWRLNPYPQNLLC